MKRTALFVLMITAIMLFSAFPVLSPGADAGTSGARFPVAVSSGDDTLDSDGSTVPYYDIHDLVRLGAADLRTIEVKDPENPLSSLHDMSWMKKPCAKSSSVWASGKDENDDFSNATFLGDGDKIENNVTSRITGTTISFVDQDYYWINLTADGINGTYDRVEITIFSEEAVKKNASLATQAYAYNFVLQQFQDTGYELTGKFHGNTSKMVFVPDGDPTLNFEYPLVLEFRAWNSTILNYTMEIKITSTTVNEGNGLFGGGLRVNSTVRPARMQKVNRSHDLFDWFDMTGVLTDNGLDTQRGDDVRFSLRVDVATEERGRFYGYAGPGLYGQRVAKTTIMFIYLMWFNYTAQQLNIATVGQGNLPYVGILFGNDPYTVGFQAKADHAWIGVSPVQLWLAGSSAYAGAEGNAEIQYNITTINANIIPPNGPPQLNLYIRDHIYNEDEGPWMNLTDLDDHFSDPEAEHNARLRYEVIRTDAPDEELQILISEDGQMSIFVTEDNWYGSGKFRIRCYDWGPNWVYNDNDDLYVNSNEFAVTISPVNDDAYIEKVDVMAGSVENNHQPIHITLPQGATTLKSKKIWGRDNDTEDQNDIVYGHNATTEAFIINQNGQYSFLPTNEDVGTTWVRVTVDDGHSPREDDHCILVFHVTNRNDKPTLVSIEWRDRGVGYDNLDVEDEPTFRSVEEDIEINLTVEAYDPDIEIGMADQLSWVLGAPGWEAHPHPTDPMRAYITYTPSNDDAVVGLVSSSLVVIDSQNTMSQEITIMLYVDNVNDRPVIKTVNGEAPVDGKITLDSDNERNGYEDEPFVLTVSAEDIDPRDDLSFSTNDPSWQQTPVFGDEFSRNFTIRPTQEMVGVFTVRITVTDEDGSADTVLVTYEIVNTNDPPGKPRIRYDESVVRYPGNDIRFWAEDAEDPDGDELVFTWDFGDGTPKVQGEEVIHNFSMFRNFLVSLTVTDPYGAEAVVETTIVIVERPVVEDPDRDTDGDGMPDTYEIDHGLDMNVNDSFLDADKDGWTNFEEFKAGTHPLQPSDHPEDIEDESGGMSILLIVILVVAAVLVILAVIFFLFVLTSKPKPVVRQQMYGAELPGAAQQQLPPQEYPQVGPARVEQLPPAPGGMTAQERPPEEDYLEGFMEEAHREVEESSSQGSEEENVWKPPVEESSDGDESQVDDLFTESSLDDEPEMFPEPGVAAPVQAQTPPRPRKLPDLPPPPEL